MSKKEDIIPEKPKISVSLDQDTFEWLLENVRNRSAFIRELIQNFRARTRVDPKYANVAATLDQLKGLGPILVPGRTYRSLVELGLSHDPETVSNLFRESGRLLGVFFSHLRDQNWLETFRQILTDLFLDVNQISVNEDETTMALRVVSAVHSEGTLFLLGEFLEEALIRLGFKIAEQSIVFEQNIGMLSQKYTRHTHS